MTHPRGEEPLIANLIHFEHRHRAIFGRRQLGDHVPFWIFAALRVHESALFQFSIAPRRFNEYMRSEGLLHEVDLRDLLPPANCEPSVRTQR